MARALSQQHRVDALRLIAAVAKSDHADVIQWLGELFDFFVTRGNFIPGDMLDALVDDGAPVVRSRRSHPAGRRPNQGEFMKRRIAITAFVIAGLAAGSLVFRGSPAQAGSPKRLRFCNRFRRRLTSRQQERIIRADASATACARSPNSPKRMSASRSLSPTSGVGIIM